MQDFFKNWVHYTRRGTQYQGIEEIPKRGTASDVLGSNSATNIENTVKDNIIVTPVTQTLS